MIKGALMAIFFMLPTLSDKIAEKHKYWLGFSFIFAVIGAGIGFALTIYGVVKNEEWIWAFLFGMICSIIIIIKIVRKISDIKAGKKPNTASGHKSTTSIKQRKETIRCLLKSGHDKQDYSSVYAYIRNCERDYEDGVIRRLAVSVAKQENFIDYVDIED